jgi:hypothetical protein
MLKVLAAIEKNIKLYQQRIERYNITPKKCVRCNTALSYEKKHNKFCNRSCAAKYNNLNRNYNPTTDVRTKELICYKCGEEFKGNIRSRQNYVKCDKCKQYDKIKLCKYCGQIKCTIDYYCKTPQQITTLIKYFNFDKSILGTTQFYRELYRIRKELKNLYLINKLSTNDIANIYNASNQTVGNILKYFGIDMRIAVGTSNKYKQGWHKTWNGNEVFYRSSYELQYMKELDEQKIKYEVESLNITYWDNQQHRYRIAIPDFYIPSKNLIVEIKSNWTYDKQNMDAKVKGYKELGYKFKLIVN